MLKRRPGGGAYCPNLYNSLSAWVHRTPLVVLLRPLGLWVLTEPNRLQVKVNYAVGRDPLFMFCMCDLVVPALTVRRAQEWKDERVTGAINIERWRTPVERATRPPLQEWSTCEAAIA